MIIKFRVPSGCGPGKEGLHVEANLPLVPQINQNVNIDDWCYRVHAVEWYPLGDPEEKDPYVYIVLRDS